MIYEWKLDGVTRNFGDTLYQLLYSTEDLLSMANDEGRCYFLVGSVICDTVIKEALGLGLLPVFINCGWRGEPLSGDLVAQSMFIGCRGPQTQDELARHGVLTNVTGDPAATIASIVPKAPASGESLLIPHIKDPLTYDYDLKYCEADLVVSPAVTDLQSVVNLVRQISGARFVLTGSLHAAIVARAYDVPFAVMKSYVDCLPKWVDWALSTGIERLEFVDKVSL